MNRPDDHDLIDRHLAGILQPEEEARLEQLIRTSPEWTRKYREAEELARLLQDHLGQGGAPLRVRRSIRRATDAAPQVQAGVETATRLTLHPRATGLLRYNGLLRNKWLVAAGLLVAIGAVYLYAPGVFSPEGEDVLPLVYANDPLPLKDLARIASIGVVGQVTQQGGMLRLDIDEVLFGDARKVSFALPEGLHPGQRVALFGTPREGAVGSNTKMLTVVGGRRGVIHLDGMQQWGTKQFKPTESKAVVARAKEVRSLKFALADLRGFLVEDASLHSRGRGDGLPYSGAVAATYLGQFPIRHIREDLMRLVLDLDKVPVARTAASKALVQADPEGSCREILHRVLQNRPHTLRAESEDGQVVLACLDLLMRHGPQDLGASLERLAKVIECPALEAAANAAAHAVMGTGPRDIPFMQPPTPQRVRLSKNGREALVMAGCQNQRDGLLVVFRNQQAVSTLRLPINLAVGRGTGVLVLPSGVRDVDPWIRRAAQTGLVDTQHIRFLGVGRAAGDALEAAARRAPEVLYLMAGGASALAKPTPGQTIAVRTHVYGSDVLETESIGTWVLHPAQGAPKDWLRDETLLETVLATD